MSSQWFAYITLNHGQWPFKECSAYNLCVTINSKGTKGCKVLVQLGPQPWCFNQLLLPFSTKNVFKFSKKNWNIGFLLENISIF